jgi:hypothetical protein
MKKLIFLLMPIVILTACDNKPAQPVATTSASDSLTFSADTTNPGKVGKKAGVEIVGVVLDKGNNNQQIDSKYVAYDELDDENGKPVGGTQPKTANPEIWSNLNLIPNASYTINMKVADVNGNPYSGITVFNTSNPPVKETCYVYIPGGAYPLEDKAGNASATKPIGIELAVRVLYPKGYDATTARPKIVVERGGKPVNVAPSFNKQDTCYHFYNFLRGELCDKPFDVFTTYTVTVTDQAPGSTLKPAVLKFRLKEGISIHVRLMAEMK